MSDTDSDQKILALTQRGPDTLTYPPLNFTVEIQGDMTGQMAMQWCNAVRGEYERQEEQRAIEARASGARVRAKQAATAAPEDAGGGPDTTEANTPEVETDLRSVLQKKRVFHKQACERLEATGHAAYREYEKCKSDYVAHEKELDTLDRIIGELDECCEYGETSGPADVEDVGSSVPWDSQETRVGGGEEVVVDVSEQGGPAETGQDDEGRGRVM